LNFRLTICLDEKGKEEEEINTTWRIPKSLLKQLKHFANDDDITLAQFITKVLKEYAERREAKK
jgi:ATP-dependent Clp protease adapter protein ClpS